MPPQGINMDVIKEAMMRRQQGDTPAPAAAQMSGPGAPTPAGGPNVPAPGQPAAMPMAPNVPPSAAPNLAPQGGGAPTPDNPAAGMAKSLQTQDSTQFDPATRDASKRLLTQLIKYL